MRKWVWLARLSASGAEHGSGGAKLSLRITHTPGICTVRPRYAMREYHKYGCVLRRVTLYGGATLSLSFILLPWTWYIDSSEASARER